MIEKIKNFSNEFFDEIVSIRRHIHKYPELSFNEYETSSYIKSILNKWHIPFKDNIADNGIVVLLTGKNGDAKTIALRADFDALPIDELNSVIYKSVNKGVMHACGHDAHTASLLGSFEALPALLSRSCESEIRAMPLSSKASYSNRDSTFFNTWYASDIALKIYLISSCLLG